MPPGPHRDLNDALHDLHHRAGWPSLRTLSRDVGCSHTTISKVFSSDALPTWGVLELLSEALHGDTAHVHQLWLAASTLGEGASAAQQSRIAGRRTELTLVRRHLEAGTGLLVVSGEAGMGKTKLVSTAADTTDTFVATGRCLPLSTQVPLLPISDALRQVHRVDDGAWVRAALDAGPRYVGEVLPRLLPELATEASAESGEEDWMRSRLFPAVEDLLRALISLRPLGLLLDDLHWGDSATLDLVEHLVAHDGLPPLEATWRLDDPGVSDDHAAWWLRMRRSPAVAVLELGPLSWEESAEQLRLLAGADVAEEVVDRIYLRSRGQPLFTEQLAAQPGSDTGLPGLLSDLLDRRLHDLDDRAWAVVATLGIADRALSEDVLASAAGVTEDALEAALRGLNRRRLLASGVTRVEVALRHPLLAEAVRRRISSGEARRAHRRLAEAIAVTSSVHAAEVAEHWRGAADGPHELEWRIRAARESAQRFAARQEAAHWLRALEIWPPDLASAGNPPVSRTRARFAAMHALESSAQGEHAGQLADEMLREPPPDPTDQAEMYMAAARYRAHHDPPAGLELLDRALVLYTRLGPSANHVRALRYREGLLLDEGRREEAEAALVRALEINESVGDWRQARRMLATVARHHVATGHHQQALVDLAEATRATSEPDPVGDIFVGMMHTDVLLELGAPVEAVAAAAEPALQASARHGIDTQKVATTRANLALALLRAGRVADAAAHVDEWTDHGPRAAHWALHLLRLHIDVQRGMLQEVVARGAALRERVVAPLILSGLSLQVEAEALVWAGQPDRALRLLEPLLERMAGSEDLQFAGSLLLLTARAAADARAHENGRSSIQADTLERIRSTVRDDPFGPRAGPFTPARARTYSAELGRLGGHQRIDAWLTAATAWDRLTRPHDSAYCRWRAADVALREGQAPNAARLLKRAAADAREHVPLASAIAQTAAHAAPA